MVSRLSKGTAKAARGAPGSILALGSTKDARAYLGRLRVPSPAPSDDSLCVEWTETTACLLMANITMLHMKCTCEDALRHPMVVHL